MPELAVSLSLGNRRLINFCFSTDSCSVKSRDRPLACQFVQKFGNMKWKNRDLGSEGKKVSVN